MPEQTEPIYLIVLTACVDPSTGPARIALMNPADRLDDYLQALRFYLDLPDPRLSRILLIENSGYDLAPFHAAVAAYNPHGKQFEAVSLRCNDYPPELDYGYAELNMLDQGLAKSRLAESSDIFIKVTGRLRFPGLPKLIRALPKDLLFAADSRNGLPVGRKPKQLWTHSTVMLFSRAFFFEHFRDVKQRLRPGECIELMLYPFFERFGNQPGAVRRFPIQLTPHGRSGTSGHSYQSGKRRLLAAARTVSRVLAPWWWI